MLQQELTKSSLKTKCQYICKTELIFARTSQQLSYMLKLNTLLFSSVNKQERNSPSSARLQRNTNSAHAMNCHNIVS